MPGQFENAKVDLREFPGKGRGVVATRDLAAGELILRSPVRVLSGIEFYLMRILPCIMHTFTWRDPAAKDELTAALAFGLVTLCNHAKDANAKTVCDYAAQCLDLVALRPINAGEEILIHYETLTFEPV